MQRKTIHSQKVIAKTVRTTLKGIVGAIADWPTRMWSEVQTHNLKIAGAPVYLYRGFDENPDTEFELIMCTPVVDFTGYHGSMETMELPEYNCMERLYIGSMPNLSAAWGEFMQDLAKQGIGFGAESREVYVKWVDFASNENQVLLQVQVKE